MEMCRMAIRKNGMRQNFYFWPSRSNIGLSLAFLGHFFALLRTRHTVWIRLGWYRMEICRMAIRKKGMRRNFDFWPPRSNIRLSLAFFGRFFVLLRTRHTVLIGLSCYCMEICRMAIRKNGMRQKFYFFSARSNIRLSLAFFGCFFILLRTRHTVLIWMSQYRMEMCKMAIRKNRMRQIFFTPEVIYRTFVSVFRLFFRIFANSSYSLDQIRLVSHGNM